MLYARINAKILNIIYIFITCVYFHEIHACEIVLPNVTNKSPYEIQVKTNDNSENFSNLRSYIPGKVYDLSVSSTNQQGWVMEELHVNVKNVNKNPIENGPVGKFIVNSTGISDVQLCANGFKAKFATNTVTFYWMFPFDVNECFELSIAVKSVQKTLESVEGFTRVICAPGDKIEDSMQADQPNDFNCVRKREPSRVKKCNIGSTALYRMEIRNNWNHMLHWKDWPNKDVYVPKMTQYIGASHSANFDIYHIGGVASAAVKNLCTNGTISTLEKQFYKAGNDILSIILARALEATTASTKRSTLVVVNSTYHLISFLTHLDPSPDWCTGLSRYDLCSGQCKWPDEVTEYLYPWDAGVYSGESYMSTKYKETGSSVICPITDMWPKDNPFTKVNGKVLNISTVTFKLIQEYNNNPVRVCIPVSMDLQNDDIEEGISKIEDMATEVNSKDCNLSKWTQWSTCSSSCGQGTKVRYRKIVGGTQEKCANLPVKEFASCFNRCPKQSTNGVCLLRQWSEWSFCNATCFHSGITFRERLYLREEERRHCSDVPGTKEMETCHISGARCHPDIVCNANVSRRPLCLQSQSQTRYYFDPSVSICLSYKGCLGGLNNFLTMSECESTCSKFFIRSRPLSRTNSRDKLCKSMIKIKVNCIFRSLRLWHFDEIKRKCFQSRSSECYKNGFLTKLQCERHCLPRLDIFPICTYSQWSSWSNCSSHCPQIRTRTRQIVTSNVTCTGEIYQQEPCQSAGCNNRPNNLSNSRQCLYSDWSPWTFCSVSCGAGFRERVRTKLTYYCMPQYPQFTQRGSCYNDC